MVRVEVIRNRLIKLDEYLGILSRLRGYCRSEFVGNPERYGSAERFLQLALEALTDMGSHVIADLNLGVVNWRSDIRSCLRSTAQLMRLAGPVDSDDRFSQCPGP